MRPEKITLDYFGPYKHETIDFTQFYDRPLFLVAGNTGAGKTTIFDAMCYALFGQTTNDRDRSATDLRSDFAPVNQETKISFTFNHQGMRYRITRRPKQVLQGRRGKLIQHNQAVNLIYPLDSSAPHELTKVKDVDSFIVGLLNMTKDQFKQIVLLPQGKFRQFLDSNSNDKETLLRNLFGTSLYAKWAEKLKDQLKTRKGDWEKQRMRIQSAKESLPQVDSQLPNSQWDTATAKYSASLDQQLSDLKGSQRQLQKDIDKYNDQLHSEQQLKKSFQELAEVKQKEKTLLKQRANIEEVSQRVNDLQWFQKHQLLYHQWQADKEHYDQLEAEISELSTEFASTRTQHTAVATELNKLQGLEGTINDLKRQHDQLKEVLPLFQDVDLVRSKVATLTKKVADNQKKEKAGQDNVTCLISQQAKLTDQLKIKDQLATEEVDLTKKQAAHQQLLQESQDLKLLVDKQLAVQKQNKELADKLQCQRIATNDQKSHYEDLNDAYARQQIAELATRLKPGSPCPVCGSPDHPQPAHLSQDSSVVTEEQVKRALNKLQSRRTTFDKLGEQLRQGKQTASDLGMQIDKLRAAVSKSLGVDKLPKDDGKKLIADSDDQLTQQENNLRGQQKRVHDWQDQLSTVKEQLADQQDKLSQVQAVGTQLSQNLAKVQTSLDEKQGRLPANFTDSEAAKNQLKNWEQEINKHKENLLSCQSKEHELAEKVAVVQNQINQTRKKQTRLKKEQVKSHTELINDLNDYRRDLSWSFFQEAADDLGELERYQQEVQTYRRALHDTQLQQERLRAQTKGKKQPNLEKTKASLSAVRQQAATIQEEIGQVRGQQKLTKEITNKVARLMSNNQQLDKRIGELQKLTDVVSGNTNTHIGLERYVLQAYFRNVLIVANSQLAQLTNGRYQFELANESHGAGAKWTGLEVNIYDDNAGKTRSARTLSGGESFMASLALSLALCQIIQEQSGGISIDAFFIDEGFGSLDRQALTDALRSLQALGGHRMIGIISHVTELEEQVPDQLIVVAHQGKSTVTYRHDF
ncbi:SMC family ATPase [Limosilactobacillus panis]|uniref:AAA family ATPase n=1 Tax=Limosilactobacillus panis TaxID=47493 RepID=UPI001C93CE5D|nr:SMC family ATPase [Limosilactobacillus panis]QZN92265.1 SMC family ATPase [Limosilactobacillus panis]